MGKVWYSKFRTKGVDVNVPHGENSESLGVSQIRLTSAAVTLGTLDKGFPVFIQMSSQGGRT